MYENLKKIIQSSKTPNFLGDKNKVLSRNESMNLINNIANAIDSNLPNTIHQRSIAILLKRNVNYIASIFAIWQLGDYFIPLNEDWPLEHKKKIINLCKPDLIINEKLNSNFKTKQLVINELLLLKNKIIFSDKVAWKEKRNHSTIAYVIFTSGSSGEQKGVVISKKAYKSYINWSRKFFAGFRNNKALIITAELTFDISLGDLAFALANNLEIHISDSSQNLIMHAKLINERKIDTFYSVPSTISRLYSWQEQRQKNVLINLRLVKSGGDVFSPELIKLVKKLSPKSNFYNVYGPTELTINCCATRVDNKLSQILKNRSIPIGKPFKHLKAKLLAEKNSKNKIFNKLKGELIIAGPQCMNGYLNDIIKTNKSFFNYKGLKYYRTGDLVEYKNNQLYLIGRIDNLVKHKGYRINTNEIDNELSKLRIASEIKTLFIKQGNETKLFTFLVSDEKYKNKIISECNKHLPRYMVPEKFIFINKMPVSISGKFDYKALENYFKKSNV